MRSGIFFQVAAVCFLLAACTTTGDTVSPTFTPQFSEHSGTLGAETSLPLGRVSTLVLVPSENTRRYINWLNSCQAEAEQKSRNDIIFGEAYADNAEQLSVPQSFVFSIVDEFKKEFGQVTFSNSYQNALRASNDATAIALIDVSGVGLKCQIDFVPGAMTAVYASLGQTNFSVAVFKPNSDVYCRANASLRLREGYSEIRRRREVQFMDTDMGNTNRHLLRLGSERIARATRLCVSR